MAFYKFDNDNARLQSHIHNSIAIDVDKRQEIHAKIQ